MSNEKKNNPSVALGNKIRFSIVFKLNMQLFFRLLGIFLALDILIGVGAVIATVSYAEWVGGRAVQEVITSGLPQDNGRGGVFITGWDISIDTQKPEGFKIPEFFQKLLIDRTVTGDRYFALPKVQDDSFYQRLMQVTYHVTIPLKGNYFVFSIYLWPIIRPWRFIFIGIGLIQISMLIGNLFWGARVAKKTLDPISELAKTAQSLNAAGKEAFTPEEMKALAGKIDGINASKLDTRIAVDSTQDELKNLAGAINGMLDRVNESYRAQVRFVSDASHELRTPISVIQGYANLLDRWGKNDEKVLQESIEAIKDEAANMKSLVEQLLFLARGDNNTMTLQIEQFELSELAEEVVRETRMIDGGHVFTSCLQPVVVLADEVLIKQAMRILVDNAIKYTPAGGQIHIAIQEKEGLAKLVVQDEGIGIPSEAVSKIFDRFYRADESRARATGGTGLGLSIAKWITERHGGHMEVLSRENIGTRITIILPAVMINCETNPDITQQ
jgi:signal transduction histidine kinase